MQYLIIPSRPTPNGRLHLGHIAGPYLRADILKRSLLRDGHKVHMISGVDAYESFMDIVVTQDNRPYRTVVEEAHQEIYSDLLAFQIGVDSFINVANDLKSFENAVHKLMSFIPGRLLTEHEEMIPVDRETNESITGAWITGKCPQCSMEVAGFICETCCALLRIEDHQHPRRRDGKPLAFQKRKRLYLANPQPEKILRTLDEKKSCFTLHLANRTAFCNS